MTTTEITPAGRAAPPVDLDGVDDPVVVGVDGGPRSVRALRWAAEEAGRRHSELVAVHACPPPPHLAPYAPVHPTVPDMEEMVEEEKQHLTAIVYEALGREPRVRVRTVCEPTSPTRALLAHSYGASLLVLATSLDTATGNGVGATAMACVRHASCPVVILPVEAGC